MATLVEFFPTAINVIPEEADLLFYQPIDTTMHEVVENWDGSVDDAPRVWFLAASFFLNRIVMTEDEAQDFADDLRVATRDKKSLLALAIRAYVDIYGHKPATLN